MIVPCPDGWTPEGWVPSAQQSKELHTKDYNIPQMVKTPIFWVLLVMFIFANAAGTMMVSATFTNCSNSNWFISDGCSFMCKFNDFI